MAAQTGLTIVKEFTYEGVAEEWSNTYWLTGSVPADATAWRALFDAVVLKEKPCFDTNTTVIRGYGYADNTGHRSGDTGAVSPAVWTVDLKTSPEVVVHGTLATAATTHPDAPGDAANWVRWRTSRNNTKGKPIFLRKYFHGVHTNGVGSSDYPYSVQKTNLIALGLAMQDGTLPGARKVTAAGQTDVITSYGANTYITTRTLHRRGKRPGS